MGAVLDLAGGASGNDLVMGFGYNPAGQIVTQTRSNAGYGFAERFAVSRGYAVNGLNQVQTAGGVGFSDDANGNLAGGGSVGYQSLDRRPVRPDRGDFARTHPFIERLGFARSRRARRRSRPKAPVATKSTSMRP